MAIDGNSPSPEREQTDEGLRTEREKTDRALVSKQAAVEKDADKLVQRARENADAIVSAARDKADHERSSDVSQLAPAAVVEERLLDDAALRDERTAADERLRRARGQSADALSKLLPLEREKTDRYLLTERARSDDAVANRDDFLGMASHDLRNLLGGIVISASLLSERAAKGQAGEQTRAETQRIQRYAARMNRLIGDLVDVASIDSGKLAVVPTPGDATALIAESVETFGAAASARGLTLESEIAERPLPAAFDHERMLQVFANVITNAIKFTERGGKIVVRGERVADELRFSITDTGLGIPDNLLEAIFERFWQVGTRDHRGLGLGLYISRSLVEAHGGRIWAQSKLGAGTTLYFTLPTRGVQHEVRREEA